MLAMACPLWEILLHGTRGSGKSDTTIMKFRRHVGQGYGQDWRGIIFRRTFPELEDIIAKSEKYFRRIKPFGRYNKSRHTWTWPGGESLRFRFADRASDYYRYHGHEYPFIGWEELTTQKDDELYELMKSCCRSPFPNIPKYIFSTTNSYGVGHGWVKARWIDAAPPGVPIDNGDGTRRVHIFGNYRENRALMAADSGYGDRIHNDPDLERRKAWGDGSWDIVAGAMFGDVWDRNIHVVKPFDIPKNWYMDRTFDWGSSAPFSTGWWAESNGEELPDGTSYPKGSLFRFNEWYGWNGKPNKGIKMPAFEIGTGIIQREKTMNCHSRMNAGPADSSIFDSEPGKSSIADDMEGVGCDFTKANKGPGSRIAGWDRIRSMLYAARNKSKEYPHLYVFDNCNDGFIRTIPALSRSEKNPDDTEKNCEDHTGDETRYRVLDISGECFDFEWRV